MKDYMFKLSITLMITSIQILLNMTLVECKLSPRVYTTRYGSLIGMMIHRNGLRPVEVFNGLQYASTRQTRLRFIPPSSSLEKWIGNRVFYNTSYRGVCPQAYMSGQGISKRPINYLKHRKNIEKHVVNQAEECLMMNLYIPRKGTAKLFARIYSGKSRERKQKKIQSSYVYDRVKKVNNNTI